MPKKTDLIARAKDEPIALGLLHYDTDSGSWGTLGSPELLLGILNNGPSQEVEITWWRWRV